MPHPAEPHPRSPAVRTGDREWGETDRLIAGQAGRKRVQAAKLVQPDVQPYPA